MQGVVGMLDVMHANVEEAIDAKAAIAKSSRLLQDLKENIELVQGEQMMHLPGQLLNCHG